MTDTVFIINGPNFNLLGTREPRLYGTQTLAEINATIEQRAKAHKLTLDIRQSNHEGHLIDWLHEAQERGAKAVILNPGGYGHTSIALHDAVKAVSTPVIEVHLSDPETRESFRHTDLVALAATSVVKGEGARGYLLALDAAARL